MFRLEVLGQPRLWSPDGDLVDLPLGKPMAALCYVALERSRVTREDLGAVLWSRSAPERAGASVRQALWLLRKAAGEDLLEEDDRGLRLDDGRVAIDLDDFEAHLSQPNLVEAWRLWDGGPLRDLRIADSPRFNRWADRVRTRWEQRFGEDLEFKAAAEDGEARVTWLRRALQVRPYRESAHAALAEAFIHQRRAEEAEAALHDARAVVDSPTPGLFADLEAQLRAIRRQPFEADPDRLHLEFVGRAEEFSALTSLWRSVLSGRPRIAMVLGPTGIGKSRLAEEFVELATTDQARVAEVKGVDGEQAIDLGALALLVKDLLALPGAAGISSGSLQVLQGLVPSSVRNGDIGAPMPGRAALGDGLLDLVEAVAHEAPLILRIEDIQWIDPSSRDLILRAARHLRNARVLLVATCRTEDADASVLQRLRWLRDQGQSTDIRLTPLTRAEVAEMLGLTFGFPSETVADAAADRLYRASGGNPLFLLELLHRLREGGFIQEEGAEGGTWQIVELPDVSLTLPRTLRAALRRRLADLDGTARAVAETLAAAEEGLRPGELTACTALPEASVTEAVAELLRRDVARWDREDRLQVAHDSMREFLRPVGAGRARRPPTFARRAVRLGGLGALGVAAAAAALLLLPGNHPSDASATEAPYGGGTLFARIDDRMIGYRLTGHPGELRLERTDSLRVTPPLHFKGPPFRTESGRWLVPAGGPLVLGEDPDAWVVQGDSARRVYATPGDDNVLQIAPDGRHYLLSVQDPEAPRFRMNMVRYDPRTGETVTLVEGSGTGLWTSDGARLVAKIPAREDSVALVRPDGTRLATASVPHGRFHGSHTWCPGTERVVGLSLPPAQGPVAWSWTPAEETFEGLDLPLPYGRGLACSPDGRGLAYFARTDEGPVLALLELETGEVTTFPELAGSGTLYWVDGRSRGAPREVRLEPDSVELARGERTALHHDLTGPSEPLPEERLAWRSSDSLVAFVGGSGQLVGNGPGEAWVSLAVDGWLSDSVLVRVSERIDGGRPVFTDRLARLDATTWYPVGFPTPLPDTLDDGQAVLSMEGDGSYRDGIVTRGTFDVSDGATVELDFNLPLTRVDRQQVQLCLVNGDPGADAAQWSGWTIREDLCFEWPAFELEDFDPGEARFHARSILMGPVRVDDVVRPDGWNRVGIQLRPDGTATLCVNDTPVGTLVDRLPLEPSSEWRLAVFGRAWETNLLVRNLVLWGETRCPDRIDTGP